MMIENTVHEKVLEAIETLGIELEVVPCAPEYADTALFCDRYNYPVVNCGNTIIVAGKADPKKYVACVVSAAFRLDVNHTVRRLMDVRRASFASAEETLILTGMAIGGVTVLGLPPEISIYLDPRLQELDYIIVGAGTRHAKLRLNPGELNKIPNSYFVDGLAN